jgi:hypothetical protein
MRAKGSSSPADAGRGGNDADDDAADDDDDNDDASRVRIIAVSGPPVEGALGAGPKPRPDWAGSGAAATDPNGDAAAPATPNGDGAPKAPVVGDAAAPATPNGDGAPKAPGDGAAPATPNGDGAPKAPVGGDVGEPATPNGDGAPPGPGRPAPGPGRNAAVGAVLTWSATSAPTGGLARNRVSHFGQRMRAPSAGTASLATRYFDAQPGQVTIIAEPSMHKERTT